MKRAQRHITFTFSREKAGGYSASAARQSIFMQGRTFEDLLKNVAATIRRRFHGKLGWQLRYHLADKRLLTSDADADTLVRHLEEVLP